MKNMKNKLSNYKINITMNKIKSKNNISVFLNIKILKKTKYINLIKINITINLKLSNSNKIYSNLSIKQINLLTNIRMKILKNKSS